MTKYDFDEKKKSIQEKVNEAFKGIHDLVSPKIEAIEFFQAHVDRIKNEVENLEKAQLEYRILLAERYNLILPEQLDEEEPEATEAVVEVQPQSQATTMAEVTTAVAGVGALISLFRKARGR